MPALNTSNLVNIFRTTVVYVDSTAAHCHNVNVLLSNISLFDFWLF